MHFKHFAPEPKTYAVNRCAFEAERHWGILNERLASRPYMLGELYTIVDMAVWGWARAIPFILDAEAWSTQPNVKRLLDEINTRPAAQRAEALKTQHAFKAEMDEGVRLAMSPQNARLSAA